MASERTVTDPLGGAAGSTKVAGVATADRAVVGTAAEEGPASATVAARAPDRTPSGTVERRRWREAGITGLGMSGTRTPGELETAGIALPANRRIGGVREGVARTTRV
jgi:hypothetical protein